MQNNTPPIFKSTLEKELEDIISYSNVAQKLRFSLDTLIASKTNTVVWRSYEMSYTVKALKQSSDKKSKILQEYFIPIDQTVSFIESLKRIYTKHKIKIINISLRHVPADNESILSYARQESFAFVIYIALDNNKQSHELASVWTQELIDAALALKGSYYLPYHLFARPEQSAQAYPRLAEFFACKKKYDPENIFNNSLISSLEKAFTAKQ